MAKHLRNFLVVLAIFALIIFLSMNVFFYYLIQSGQLKEMSEEYLTQLLNSDVKIHKIEPHLFHKVKISGIEVKLSESSEPFWIHINEVVFNYNLFQLLSNKIKSPTTIELATPSLRLNHREVFKELNSPHVGSLSSLFISQINLVGGKLDYYFPSLNKTMRITDVEVRTFPSSDKRLNIEMKGETSGFFNSHLKLEGYWDLEKQDYSFKLFVSKGSFDLEVADRFEGVEGFITLQNNSLLLNHVQATSNGWNFELSGTINELDKNPESDISIQIGKASESISRIHVEHKFSDQIFKGDVDFLGVEKLPFSGKIIPYTHNIQFKQIKMGIDYHGEGEFDFKSGEYYLRFHNKLQRFLIRSNLNGDELFLDLDLNHFKLFDLDLVALAAIRFWPSENRTEGESWKLRGQLTSRYFILEQQPLENFEGSFLLSSQGIEDLRTTWGDSFEMNGDISMSQGKANAQLALRILDYDLSRVEELLSKPLPKEITGTLNGKLKIEGKISKPEVLGQFTVKEGSVGKLDFDRMMIQARGFPPYLKLNDSRIIKGRTKFHLVGAFDLSLDNPFHGIHVETADKVIVWKGLSLTTNQEGGGVDFETALPGLGKLALDFSIDSGQDQSRRNDELQDENYVSIKPKINF
jgi:hypothetical protein